MENPFEKRATEFVGDTVSFLALVAPEPVNLFLVPAAEQGFLYDRLVIVNGTPGSGKTTLARLFEFPSLYTLLQLTGNDDFRELTAAMSACGAVRSGLPRIIGCRLPLESDYRDFWEFPYSPQLKSGLMTALLQARAVLTWLRHLRTAGIPEDSIEVVPRNDAESSVVAIGGVKGRDVAARARAVESAVYRLVSALVPPSVDQLESEVGGAYHPFDVIEHIRIQFEDKPELILRPLAVFDDAHELQQEQYQELRRWLARRELRISRWMLTRLDVLSADEALETIGKDSTATHIVPGLTAGRDHVNILLQSSGKNRAQQRRSFRKMAKDMGNRYLRRMALFMQRGHSSLANLLLTDMPEPSEGTLKQLEEKTLGIQRKLKISNKRRSQLEADIDSYLQGATIANSTRSQFVDVQHVMSQILMHRYSRRSKGPSLFQELDPDPSRPLKVDASLFDKACLQMLHTRNRPYYYGIDKLCDAATENAELFLHLAGSLVKRSATQVIRSDPPLLTPKTQQQLLRERAEQILENWNYPYYIEVRKLTEAIALRCIDVLMEPNAWLAPNAFGIPQDEFDSVVKTHPHLARVLQFAVAYNAIALLPQRQCKNVVWCILELGGVCILKHGLSLSRGDFLEGTLAGLAELLEARP